MQVIQAIVQKYVNSVGSRADAHRQINELLDEDLRISHQIVYGWFNGKYRPSPRILKDIRVAYPEGDWRHELAVDLLAAYQVVPAELAVEVSNASA